VPAVKFQLINKELAKKNVKNSANPPKNVLDGYPIPPIILDLAMVSILDQIV